MTEAEPVTESEPDKDQENFYHYGCIRVAIKPFDQQIFHQDLGRICKKYELPGDVQPMS